MTNALTAKTCTISGIWIPFRPSLQQSHDYAVKIFTVVQTFWISTDSDEIHVGKNLVQGGEESKKLRLFALRIPEKFMILPYCTMCLTQETAACPFSKCVGQTTGREWIKKVFRWGHEGLTRCHEVWTRTALHLRGVYIENHANPLACIFRRTFSHAKQWHTFANSRAIGSTTQNENNAVLSLVISVNIYWVKASKFDLRNVFANPAHGGLTIPRIPSQTKREQWREMFWQTEQPHWRCEISCRQSQNTPCLELSYRDSLFR